MSKTAVFFLAILFCTSDVGAEEWDAENWDGLVAIRLGLPVFGAIENINGEGDLFQLGAVQLGVYTASQWSAELEYELLLAPTGGGYAATARFGRTFQIHGPKPWESGAKGYLVPLLGYQYSDRPIHGKTDSHALNYLTNAVELAFAYDLNWGVGGGFTIRGFTAIAFALSTEKQNIGYWTYAFYEPMRWGVKVGLRVGYNFSF